MKGKGALVPLAVAVAAGTLLVGAMKALDRGVRWVGSIIFR